MRITLISPRLALQKGDFLGSGVPYWPLELAILASFLRDRGRDVYVIDLFGSSPKSLEEKADHYLQGCSIDNYQDQKAIIKADVIIIYALSYMSHVELLSIVRAIRKKRKTVPIAVLENSQSVTGYSVQQLADSFFNTGADFLLCGDVYYNWDAIESYITSSKYSLLPENVIVPGQPQDQIPCRQIEQSPSFPYPAWELFNLKGYWNLPYSHGPKTNKYLPILTSRGCPYNCNFCVIPETNKRRWRPRAAEEVVDEMIYFRNNYKVKHFQIEDLNPTIDGRRWDTISNLLIKQRANISFYFVSGTKAESIKIKQIPLWAQAGCRYISISPESGSLSVLKDIGKPFDYDHALKLVSACRKYDIKTQACFLVGHPAESKDDHQKSCEYLRALVRAGLDEVAVFVVSSFAGSKLFAEQKIGIANKLALPSFSPKGRDNFEILSKRRTELIWIFFTEKIKNGKNIWFQGVNALIGRPRTKMENMPRRIAYIYWLLLINSCGCFVQKTNQKS